MDGLTFSTTVVISGNTTSFRLGRALSFCDPFICRASGRVSSDDFVGVQTPTQPLTERGRFSTWCLFGCQGARRGGTALVSCRGIRLWGLCEGSPD